MFYSICGVCLQLLSVSCPQGIYLQSAEGNWKADRTPLHPQTEVRVWVRLRGLPPPAGGTVDVKPITSVDLSPLLTLRSALSSSVDRRQINNHSKMLPDMQLAHSKHSDCGSLLLSHTCAGSSSDTQIWSVYFTRSLILAVHERVRGWKKFYTNMLSTVQSSIPLTPFHKKLQVCFLVNLNRFTMLKKTTLCLWNNILRTITLFS